MNNYLKVIDALNYNTPLGNLKSIIKTGMLYNQEDRKKYGIIAESGYGDSNRDTYDACTDFVKNPELKDKCRDAKGITMGIIAYGNENIPRLQNMGNDFCSLIFSNDLLEDKYYHVNTIDNLGFYIYDNTDDKYLLQNKYARSFTDETIIELTPEIYYYYEIDEYFKPARVFFQYNDIELLVKDSISLKYLICIAFTTQEKLDEYKQFLDKMNIETYLIDKDKVLSY